jgi:hypothetical protein
VSGSPVDVPAVNHYLAYKQHLCPGTRLNDIVQVTRDLVALHATAPTGPTLSLWARGRDFRRADLEEALYERRTLVRVLCMRGTLHAVPRDQVPAFHQAYVERHARAERRRATTLLVQAGLCDKQGADDLLADVQRRVLEVVTERGPCTVRAIGQAVPELHAKVQHSVDKPYAGAFSLGSRLVPGMCALGLLVRARPRGTWRSNLYTYASLAQWLPDVDLHSVTPSEARTWLVHVYLAAYGPATVDDVLWWTGLSKGEVQEGMRALEGELTPITIEGLEGEHWMLAPDASRLATFPPPDCPTVSFLPGLDPYMMGYRDRRRFLDPAHRAKVYDRAGNAVPTVWAEGRVVGAWGQGEDGGVVYRLFEPLSDEARALLDGEARRLEAFLEGEVLRSPVRTAFTRAL